MVSLRGTMMFVLFATLTVACDGGPTAPTPVIPTPATPVDPTEVTITVEHPYPVNTRPVPQHPGISGVTVICLRGCEGGEDDKNKRTNEQGVASFEGHPPLTIRAEKSGYIATEQQVTVDTTVLLGHEWPSETAASLRRLKRHSSLAARGRSTSL